MRAESVRYAGDAESLKALRQTPARRVEAIRRIAKGVAASSGIAEGRAAVLDDPQDIAAMARVPSGSVLVCRTAPPDLTIIIPRLKAMAVEHGGMLSVAAGAARSAGIPVVTGVIGLTGMVHDGDTIRVDGTRGIVEVIENTFPESL